MRRYDLRLKPSAAKDLRGIPREDLTLILGRIEALRDNPRPAGCEKPSGQEKYRLRPGSDRILYRIADAESLVEVVKVGHWRVVYRDA